MAEKRTGGFDTPKDACTGNHKRSRLVQEGNLYKGCTFPTRSSQIDIIDVAKFYAEHGGNEGAARAFFDGYVSKRKPVVLRGQPRDGEWKGHLWSREYLEEKAGSCMVKVEKREDRNANFGRGMEVRMRFGDALKQIFDAKSELIYLTTQDLEIGPDDRPSLMSAPVTHLLGDFPLQPSLLGTLVPQNMNLWLGRSSESSSSGLHHDFHDNLYVLLMGKKRFMLYSPADAERMYTVGKVVRVNPNGRINYEGQITEADGREPGAESSRRAAKEVERAADDEAALERALEEVLDAERAFGEDGEGDDDGDDDSGEDDDDDDGEMSREDDEEEEADTSTDAVPSSADTSTDAVPSPKPHPDNFSRVNTASCQAQGYPLFADAVGVECVVNEGECLYLPCGWFHEVTSSGGVHCAFNYWFHPPTTDSYEAPYDSDFWPSDWEERLPALRRAVEAAQQQQPK